MLFFFCFLFFCRTTILAAVAFLDAFQKVADMATNSRGKRSFLLIQSISASSQWGHCDEAKEGEKRHTGKCVCASHFSL